MMLATPVLIDGNVYDRVNVSLSVSGLYNPDGTLNSSAAVRIVPARIGTDPETGVPVLITADAAATSLFRGSLETLESPEEQQAAEAMRVAVIGLLRAKGF
jgi:hypothetical protein